MTPADDAPELLLLGPVELRLAGREVPSPGLKARGVLAMLGLAAGNVVPTDQLVDGVWGEDPPVGVANALQYHVSVLRKTLAAGGRDDSLQTRPPGYRLDLGTDVAAFARFTADGRAAAAQGRPADAVAAYTAALDLWRGPALADLVAMPFVEAKALALEAARLGTLEAVVDVELAAGRPGDWIVRLEELVASHPTRERFWAQLMTALYRSGQQAAALEAYARARRLLDEELGVDPSPALKKLHGQVLAQDATLDGPALRPTAATGRGISLLATRLQAGGEVARLVVVGGTTVPLGGQPVLVGRHPSCDLVLDDVDVSRQHLRVEPAEDGPGHLATDLGSTNGTWVDGQRLAAPTPLAHGDRLRVGATTIVYEVPV